jgi:hypothetical protein
MYYLKEEYPTIYTTGPGTDMYSTSPARAARVSASFRQQKPQEVCVEFGEQDITTTPEWHARAWAQVEEFARAWDARDRIVRDRFDGPHEIHGVLTFQFLDRWLRPVRASERSSLP